MRIPTTVITGHLGAGKTSAIAHLLSLRPTTERWAVIVNEFGELGVDGATLQRNDDGLLLEEVTGACICCGMGSPLLFVLERLLDTQRFDRLVVEPTGLAEPTAVTDSFGAPTVRDQLQRNALVCLVDIREAAVQRWRGHATFSRQVHAADVLVGNFADEATAADKDAFEAFAATLEPAKQQVRTTHDGKIPLALLDIEPVRAPSVVANNARIVGSADARVKHDLTAESRSYRAPSTAVIDRPRLTTLLESFAPNLLRAKGFIRTAYAFKRFDIDGGATLRWKTIASAPETRIELIAERGAVDWDDVSAQILALLA
jgi:G3E family GTPase